MKLSYCSLLWLLLPGMVVAMMPPLPDSDSAASHQQMESFCSTHVAECAKLDSLRATSRGACGNAAPDMSSAQSESSTCRSARNAEMAQIHRLETEGLPRPSQQPGRDLDNDSSTEANADNDPGMAPDGGAGNSSRASSARAFTVGGVE